VRAGEAPASLRALRAAVGADLGLDLNSLPAVGLVPTGAAAPGTGGDS
ncbi:MAG: hypothetical protein IH621_07660, partial [Krumholzibacteria bacterium]|nr:hypothetical protein [Candidatus Krumholzibacteria bacterium]